MSQRGASPDPTYHIWVQWEFQRQWNLLRARCAALNVLLLGDVPIFVPLDSADVQDNPRLFRLDRSGRPEVVTGVPPDCFSTTGQLWGHPHYRWSEHRRTGFAWWIARIAASLARFDALRIDHFVGFVHAYEISGTARTARRGTWRPTPGAELLTAVERACGRLPLVAEDLGAVTPAVTALREQFLGAMGVPAGPFKAMEEQTRRNMAMFQEAMKVFVPFAGMPGVAPANPPSSEPPSRETAEPLQSLQEQMKEMQRQIDRLSGKKD